SRGGQPPPCDHAQPAVGADAGAVADADGRRGRTGGLAGPHAAADEPDRIADGTRGRVRDAAGLAHVNAHPTAAPPAAGTIAPHAGRDVVRGSRARGRGRGDGTGGGGPCSSLSASMRRRCPRRTTRSVATSVSPP